MGTEKTKWRELGLTPRQLSKKMGVTCSMAEFIAQSYRVPLNVEGPQVACACSACMQETSKKKVKCACNIAPRNRCEKVPDLPVFAASCSRKRRSEEELSNCDDSPAACAWKNKKEVHKSTSPSCCDPQSSTCCQNNCYKVSTSTCYRCPSRSKRCKASPRRKPRCSKPKRKPKSRKRRTTKARTRKTVTRSKKQRRVPLTLCLKLPINIYLDEQDGVTIDNEEQPCMNYQPTCSATQTPLLQDYFIEPIHDNCKEPRPGHSAQQQETGDESLEETDSEENIPSDKDCSSDERDDCRMKEKDDCSVKVKENRQLSWWETFQECVAYLESFLSSLVNKC